MLMNRDNAMDDNKWLVGLGLKNHVVVEPICRQT